VPRTFILAFSLLGLVLLGNIIPLICHLVGGDGVVLFLTSAASSAVLCLAALLFLLGVYSLTRRYNDLLHCLAEKVLSVHSASSLDTVLQVVAREACCLIGANLAVLRLTVEDNHEQARTVASLSDRYAAWRNCDNGLLEQGLCDLVCQTNRPARLTQAELEVHPLWSRARDDSAQLPLRGWLAAPLVSRSGRNIGLISLSDRNVGEFTAQDEAILVQLARLASVAIENALLSRQLRQADLHKDAFLAMLAHELRNPLAPLRNAAQVLRLRDDPVTVQWASDLVDRQVEHLTRLIADLLDTSKLTHGKVRLQCQRLDLVSLVRTTAEDHRAELERAGLTLQFDLPARGAVSIRGDPTRLAQVLGNLLHNAGKFTDAPGQVTVRLARTESRAVVSVEDTGVGIEPALLPRVFDALTQADNSLDRTEGGLGLGLAVVKGLVELHGGGVSVHSAGPRHGARFDFWLPIEE